MGDFFFFFALPLREHAWNVVKFQTAHGGAAKLESIFNGLGMFEELATLVFWRCLAYNLWGRKNGENSLALHFLQLFQLGLSSAER